jgi:hypothetical protein
MRILEVIAIFLVSVAMSLALAHALEWPGKRRLDQATYRAVQAIYYPGFTLGGFSEWIGIIATIALLWTTPRDTARFGWILIALVCLVAMHAVYWTVTHPVNKFWLADTDLSTFGARFFGTGSAAHQQPRSSDAELWRQLRNRWEYSHVIRAGLAAAALVALLMAFVN